MHTQTNNNLNITIMKTKLYKICEIAKKCGFEVKHKEDNEKVVFVFKSNESALNCFFEVKAQNDENEKKIRENVAHEVFLFSENIDLNTETKKYLKKIGGNLKQYGEIYSEMLQLCWQIRKFWFSL